MKLGRTELGKRLFHSAERMLFAILISSTSTLSNSYPPMDRNDGKTNGIRLLSLGKSSSGSADRSDAGPQMVEAQDQYHSSGFFKNMQRVLHTIRVLTLMRC
jgi:hypothetical protein